MNEEKNRRMTRQRKLVLEILRETDRHPTANWIYDQARRKIPNISLGTIYRNLNILKEQDEIIELDYGAGYSRFDGTPENHYHFRCQLCRKVMDVELPLQNKLNFRVEDILNCQVETHRLEFYGRCMECGEKEKEK